MGSTEGCKEKESSERRIWTGKDWFHQQTSGGDHHEYIKYLPDVLSSEVLAWLW